MDDLLPTLVVQCADLSPLGGGLPSAIAPVLARLSCQMRINLVSFRGGAELKFPLTAAAPFNPFAAKTRQALHGADIVHTHGLWTSLSASALLWHAATHKPTIVSPHGMLDAWPLAQSRQKKRMALLLIERPHLNGASVVHALNVAEAESIRSLGIRAPVAIISNGVDLAPPRPPPLDFMDRPTLLFLGRLHRKKGVSELISAFTYAAQRLPGWRLAIAGWDDGENRFRDEATASGADIVFPGPLFGERKAAAYAHAAAFVLPSLSEGLPMTVLEAWAAGTPVLMTDACNLPEGFAAGAAARIATDPRAMADIFVALLPNAEWRSETSKAGRVLATTAFGWDRIAENFTALYLWTLGVGSRPDFIYD